MATQPDREKIYARARRGRIKSLTRTLQSERSELQTKITVIAAMSELKDPRIVTPLIEALDDTQIDVRLAAARSLGYIGVVRAVDPLIELLQDENKYVRLASVRALGCFNNAIVVKPIKELLHDEESAVRKAALEVVNQYEEVDMEQHTFGESNVPEMNDAFWDEASEDQEETATLARFSSEDLVISIQEKKHGFYLQAENGKDDYSTGQPISQNLAKMWLYSDPPGFEKEVELPERIEILGWADSKPPRLLVSNTDE